MKDTYKTTATLNTNKGYYQHFGIRECTACLYGDKVEDIREIVFKVSEDQSIPESNIRTMNADYWGWYETDKDNFTLIYPQRFLLEMCFPHGLQKTEEALKGKQKALRLEIVEVMPDKDNFHID